MKENELKEALECLSKAKDLLRSWNNSQTHGEYASKKCDDIIQRISSVDCHMYDLMLKCRIKINF